jgi:hypothetical protein
MLSAWNKLDASIKIVLQRFGYVCEFECVQYFNTDG